jgi:hypothetical protein
MRQGLPEPALVLLQGATCSARVAFAGALYNPARTTYDRSAAN